MVLILCTLDFQNIIQNSNLYGPLVSEILIFKLILIFKFHNGLCALGFEAKYSYFFCRSLRTCTEDFTINKIIIHVLKPQQKNLECLTLKPNAHGTF